MLPKSSLNTAKNTCYAFNFAQRETGRRSQQWIFMQFQSYTQTMLI